ncbi:J domain-containing protein [Shewanella submarina]|uniref:J domain-containing protein n=1 Tax=Shewanella submarina TaxID=2016376 RepID=A0ABV7GDZ5_9GAMM|nr:J domain-containing protein [Shewanella submarina]MCL1037774.1 J domain-containing protein [Shewanella submarina]
MNKNHYLTLKIDLGATQSQIETAYQIRHAHYADAGFRGSPVFAGLMLQDINEAYRVLSQPELRLAYDESYKALFINTHDLQYSERRSYEDWVSIESSYPEVRLLETSLKSLSPTLSMAFRRELLSSREYLGAANIVRSIATELMTGQSESVNGAAQKVNFKRLFWIANLTWLVSWMGINLLLQ